MRTYLDCIPCFFQQALRAGRIATEDEAKLKQLLDEIGAMIRDIPLENTPPETGMRIYEKVHEITGNFDPYKALKEASTKEALALYPALKRTVEKSHDKLLTAIRIAIAGNVIDFGPNREFSIAEDIRDTLTKEFAIFDYDAFKAHLEKTDEILYLGDNAGEAVFDRILIEELSKPVTYVVRAVPVINDVTREDALQAGIDTVATIMSSGTSAPGTILRTCTEAFNRLYNSSNFIVSKGQGNYEGLSHETRPVFFLLKVKCPVIAQDIGVTVGDIVLKGMNV